jgi:hypothetical protein
VTAFRGIGAMPPCSREDTMWLDAEHDRAGRVNVGVDLSVPSHPDIFLAGGTAAVTDQPGIPGTASPAKQMGHSEPNAPLRERMRLKRFWRPTRPTVSLQSVKNLWAPTASDIESPTDLDWVSLCFETEISRCALDSCMAQQRSNCLQIARAFQNVESLRPA